MSDLFTTPEATESTKSRALPGSAYVKQIATSMATQVMAKIPEGDAAFLQTIKDSQTNASVMDTMIQDLFGETLHNDTVAEFDHDEAAKILKSNQSNRSRRKNLPMTQSNYVEMLAAAIAETIIRESCDMHKSASPFGGARRSSVEITPESAAELGKDQDALGRAIRNIQSKKSTYKAKNADRDYVDDPEWQKLLEQEALLKAQRIAGHGGNRKGMTVKRALQYIFDGVEDVSILGKEESHSILQQCLDLAKGVYPEGFEDMIAAKLAEDKSEADADPTADDGVYAE